MRLHTAGYACISASLQLSCRCGVLRRYLPNGKFDLRAYDRLLDLQVANGVDGVIVGGTTGVQPGSAQETCQHTASHSGWGCSKFKRAS